MKVSPSTSFVVVSSVTGRDDELTSGEAKILNEQLREDVTVDDPSQQTNIRPLLEMHLMDLDAIETDPLQVSNNDHIEVNTDTAIDLTEQQEQQSQLINDGIKV